MKKREAIQYPNGHRVTDADRTAKRIPCCKCPAHAGHCEYAKGSAFYYYCDTCWETPGPDGTTPQQRAFLPTGSSANDNARASTCPGCNRAYSTCWVMPCLHLEVLMEMADAGNPSDLARWAEAAGARLTKTETGEEIRP